MQIGNAIHLLTQNILFKSELCVTLNKIYLQKVPVISTYAQPFPYAIAPQLKPLIGKIERIYIQMD